MLKNVLWFYLSVVYHMGKFVDIQRCCSFSFSGFPFAWCSRIEVSRRTATNATIGIQCYANELYLRLYQ